MLIKEFVSLLRNYHDAGKNASRTYEGEQPRVAELSKVRNRHKLEESRNLKREIKNIPLIYRQWPYTNTQKKE